MNRLISFTGGLPNFSIDEILWNDDAIREALQEVFRGFGDNYIIQGCTGTTSITAGYIMLDGELLKVDAHTKTDTHFAKVVTYDALGDITFNDGVARQTWQKNRATISASSGSLAYATAERLNGRIVTLNKASTSEAQALSLNTVFITPSTLSDVNGGFLTKEIPIGDWNMVSTVEVYVNHGVSNPKSIRVKSVTIRDDTDLAYNDLYIVNSAGVCGGTVVSTNAPADSPGTQIQLRRITGGLFDNDYYDSTSYNRGWIVIEYKP